MKRPSLTRLFEAPDHHLATFGWVCGYSADATFMNEAVECFTGLSTTRRAQEGRTVLALMLDPGQAELSPLDVPGVLHMPALAASELPFRLLHAKLAVLGFRHQHRAEAWRVRLVVSTGNWTVQTVEESLDLAWHVEVDGDELGAPDDEVRQRCADIAAACDLIDELKPLFDQRSIQASLHGRPGPTATAVDRLAGWIDKVRRRARGVTPRVFDNRRRSLIAQLPSLVKAHGGSVARNTLIMGSGFFQGDMGDGRIPGVLAGIVETLEENSLLTRSAEKTVVVNEEACQAVAAAVPALRDAGWIVRPPGRPDALFGAGSRRTLHAKFLFGANWRNGPDRCASAWVYLGSGNLTKPGFMLKAGRATGNLEVGVVFDPGELTWTIDARHPERPAVTSLLPVQFDVECSVEQPPCGGAAPPERPIAFTAAPVACLQWQADGEAGLLTACGEALWPYEVLDLDERPCEQRDDGAWIWRATCPRQVLVRWRTEGGETAARHVPVLDGLGRMAPLARAPLAFDDLERLLAAFPTLPAGGEDDMEPEPPEPAPLLRRGAPGARAGSMADSSARAVVRLLEAVGRRQSSVDEDEWPAWCLRLEEALTQAADSDDLARFRSLRLDPLPVLRAAPFLPAFAVDCESPSAHHHAEVLDRVSRVWQVHGFHAIGEGA